METFKIIALVLLCEVVLYYLFTCYHKWTTAVYPDTKDIFNPLRSWREAERQKRWFDGYEAHKESITDQLAGIERNGNELKQLSEKTEELSKQIDQMEKSKESKHRISAN
jgi:succinate dehydrogenase/fumarate reductase flavoprotein subunit